MARQHQLALLGIALAVLLAHWAGLAWLQSQWTSRSQLKPLARTFYTRMLAQSAPAALPPPATAPAPAAPASPRSLAAVAPRPASPKPSPPRREPPRDNTAQAPPVPQPPASAASAPDSAPATAQADDAVRAPSAGAVLGPTPAASVAAAAPASASAPASAASATAAAVPVASTASAAQTSASSAAPADLWPADTRLSYRLTGYYRGDLYGDARVQWQRVGDGYQVRVEVDVGPLTLLTMTSQGKVTPQGLQPAAYEEILRNRRRSVALEATEVVLEQARRVARPAGVQDTASQFVELAHLFASGRVPLVPGQSVQFPMARPSALDVWTYDMVAETTLRTPQLGEVRAIHLRPRPIANPRGNIRAEMWFAPSLQYLPVRIRILVGEDAHVDLLVDKIEQR